MTRLEDFLKTHNGGRVLDIACGAGAFTRRLAEHLASYDNITGIDIKADARDDFLEAVGGHDVTFIAGSIHDFVADADTFDTLSVSNALHHLENVGDVLRDVVGILADGGTMIVNEMHRDNLTPTQQTQFEQHRFLADLQRAAGEYHRETFRRDEILAFVRDAGLDVLHTFENDNADADASREPGRIIERAGKAIEAAYPHGAPMEIASKLQQLSERSATVGSSPPPQLTLVCRRR